MLSSPAMKAFVTRLAKLHDTQFILCPRERRLYLQREGLPCLGVVMGEETVSISLEEIWDGEPYLNPEVLFYTGTGQFVPIYSSRLGEKDRFYARRTGNRGELVPVTGTEEHQAEEARFCDKWARELETQGWLEGA